MDLESTATTTKNRKNPLGVTNANEETRINNIECRLTWTDLGYSIYKANFFQRKLPCLHAPTQQIIEGLNGYAQPGKFLAIIGSSGAGKTTFLNILANRVQSGNIQGDVSVNGIPLKNKRGYQRIIGYVQQNDCLLPFLTVRETLLFSALLTLPRTLSFSDKMRRVNALISELGLEKCADSYVGNELVRGISGGQKKRLSIGIELLRDPAILFLDEPTSGLDAQIALGVCEHLSRLAKKYRYTVITTIHQPRALIFQQFDLLMVLAPGGRQIYFGDAQNALTYFAQEGYECPVHENPADYFIDCTSIDFRSPEARQTSEERIQQLASSWKATKFDPNEHDETPDLPSDPKQNKPSFWIVQMLTLTQRCSLNEIRNGKFLFSRLMQSVFLAVVLGLLFLQIDNDQTTIADRNGVLFFAIVTVSFNEILASLAIFLVQREVLFRERDSKAYRISAFWAATNLSLLPYQLFFPGIFAVILYWMVGLQGEWYKFMIFLATIELVGFYTSGVGMVLGALLPPTVAAGLAPVTNILGMLFAGFLVNLDNIPAFIRWLNYLSYAKYAFDSVVQNEFRGLILTCTNNQLVDGNCPVTRGEQVIKTLNLEELDYYQNLLILLAFGLFFRVLLYFVLKKARPTST